MQDPNQRAMIAIDIESTGTDVRLDRIVEVCILQVDADLNVQGEWVQRFNPGMPIPAEATAIHGITDQDVATAPSFAFYADKVQAFVEGAVVIAYNGIRFDVPLLHNELRRAGQPGLPPTPPVIDPFQLYKEDAPRNLETAMEYYLGKTVKTSHAAKEDCLAMLEIARAQAARRSKPPEGLIHVHDQVWLDHERKFYVDKQGRPCFGFGKHRNELVEDHVGYLYWMLRDDFSDDVKAIAKRLIDEHTIGFFVSSSTL